MLVVAEQIGRSIENEPRHRKTLDVVARIGEIVQSVRQPIPPCLNGLRFQRRRTLSGEQLPLTATGIRYNLKPTP
ncbi:hypothetical protein ACFYPZ_37900 [Streptomyces sp. NPDC005506]|uniref:hypothetical protein n=1 Tax=unclassified Streptomyces TaxID=2593676 RepID=UPI0036B2CCA9